MMGQTNHISCVNDSFYFYCVYFFFDDESDNAGSGSGSSSTCDFPFFSRNSVGSVSGV